MRPRDLEGQNTTPNMSTQVRRLQEPGSNVGEELGPLRHHDRIGRCLGDVDFQARLEKDVTTGA